MKHLFHGLMVIGALATGVECVLVLCKSNHIFLAVYVGLLSLLLTGLLINLWIDKTKEAKQKEKTEEEQAYQQQLREQERVEIEMIKAGLKWNPETKMYESRY